MPPASIDNQRSTWPTLMELDCSRYVVLTATAAPPLRIESDPRTEEHTTCPGAERGWNLEGPALAAVHDDGCAADPARSWRCQERNNVANLVGPSEPAEG